MTSITPSQWEPTPFLLLYHWTTTLSGGGYLFQYLESPDHEMSDHLTIVLVLAKFMQVGTSTYKSNQGCFLLNWDVLSIPSFYRGPASFYRVFAVSLVGSHHSPPAGRPQVVTRPGLSPRLSGQGETVQFSQIYIHLTSIDKRQILG